MAKKNNNNPEVEPVKISKKGFLNISKMFNYTSKYKITFTVGTIFLVLSSLTTMAFPYVMGKLVDAAVGKGHGFFSSLNNIVIFLIIVLILQSIFSFLRIWLFSKVSENTIADIRLDLYNKMLELPVSFFEKSRVGELTSRLTNDVTQLQDSLSTSLAEFLRQIITLIVGVGIIFFISLKLTLFMLATFPFLVLAAFVFGKKIRAKSKNTQDQLATTMVVVEETLQAINTVKAFVNEVFESNRYQSELKKVTQNALSTSFWRAMFVSFVIFAIFGGIILVLWYGATLVQNNELKIGELTSFVIFTGFIGASVGGIGEIFSQLQKTMGASERIIEILQLDSEVYNNNVSAIADVDSMCEIKFNKLTFAYPSRLEYNVLDEISFDLLTNQKIALVGESGGGKSTIVQLLLRFYSPQNGTITLNGINVSELDLKWYRNLFGIVSQEVMLFGGTILDNIKYGNPHASEYEIIEAAKSAFAFDFINSFQDGFNTIVGERGVKLSGGQRQRIAIARALLKNPKILILDEATSALDSSAELEVQNALDNLMQNRTTLIIAHRLSTIKNADKILVLENGKILEQGSHDELIRNPNGKYNMLYTMQSKY